MKTEIRVHGILVALLLILVPGEVTAQSYPNKPIRLVVGYPPGASPDFLARLSAPRLAERLGLLFARSRSIVYA